MRWIWIDKFVEFESGKRAVAIKNVTLAEEHLHDHFPGFPVMPETLCIEGMAQTAGILVGEAKHFGEKVILAKIRKAVFFDYVKPGDTIKLEATIETISKEAASTTGRITRLPIDCLIRTSFLETGFVEAGSQDLTKQRFGGQACGEKIVAEIDLMFSHIDRNIAGKEFPEENFVFTDTFKSLMRSLSLKE